MTQPWRVGIVGCGLIAGGRDQPRAAGPIQTHAQAYARNPRFHLVAAVDPDTVSLTTFQEVWNIPRGYVSLDELLAHERLDVISLCSPTEHHASQAMQMVTSGRSPSVLFMEKPVCLIAEELARLKDLVRQSGVTILVNHTRRFDPSYRRIAERIQSGELGELIGGRCLYYGGWLNNGTHLIDTLRLFLPQRILRVSSAAPAPGGRGTDENVLAYLTIGEADVALEPVPETAYQLFEIDLRFTGGRLQLLDAGERIIVWQAGRNRVGEPVLARAKGWPVTGLETPLAEAVGVIEACLEGSSRIQSLGVDLDTVGETMRMVWQARELAFTPPPAQLRVDHTMAVRTASTARSPLGRTRSVRLEAGRAKLTTAVSS